MTKRTRTIIVILVLIAVVLLLVYWLWSTGRIGSHGAGTGAENAQGSGAEGARSEIVSESAEGAAGVEITEAADREGVETVLAWMELPMPVSSDEYSGCMTTTHRAHLQGANEERNYTIFYDPKTMVAYWVAYPICAAHLGSGREEAWGYDPKIAKEHQTKVAKGYGASIATINYPKNFYARGHQIANADRSGAPEMMAQTYYSTNMTPQLQNGFNGGIWAKLEDAVRGMVPQDDTLYVVTGAVFAKRGESANVATIVNVNDAKTLPVPNYYYKVILKVERDAATGAITDAKTLGFWLPHEDLKGHTFSEFTTSVDQIESYTGFDFFPSLPDHIEAQAEANASLAGF